MASLRRGPSPCRSSYRTVPDGVGRRARFWWLVACREIQSARQTVRPRSRFGRSRRLEEWDCAAAHAARRSFDPVDDDIAKAEASDPAQRNIVDLWDLNADATPAELAQHDGAKGQLMEMDSEIIGRGNEIEGEANRVLWAVNASSTIEGKGASGHSEYPRPFSVNGHDVQRVTGYNTAAAVAGRPAPVVCK